MIFALITFLLFELVGGQTPCALTTDCLALGSQSRCTNRICECLPGYYLNPATSICEPQALIDASQIVTQSQPPQFLSQSSLPQFVQQGGQLLPQQQALQQQQFAQQQQQLAQQLAAPQSASFTPQLQFQQQNSQPLQSLSQLQQPLFQQSSLQDPRFATQQQSPIPQQSSLYSSQQQLLLQQQQMQALQQLAAQLEALTAAQNAPTTAPPTKRRTPSDKQVTAGVCLALGAPCNDNNALTFGDICAFPYTGAKELSDTRASYRSAPNMDDLDFDYPLLGSVRRNQTSGISMASTKTLYETGAMFKSSDRLPVPPRLTCQGFVVPHLACLGENGKPKPEGSPCVRVPNRNRGDIAQVDQTCTFVQSGTQKSLQCVGTAVDDACMANGVPIPVGAKCYPEDPLWNARCVFDSANNAIRCTGVEVSPDCVVRDVPLPEGSPCQSSDSFPNGVLVDTTCRMFQDEDMTYPYLACIGVFVTSECMVPGSRSVLPRGAACTSVAPGVFRGSCQLDGSVVRCIGIQAIGSCMDSALTALEPGAECLRSGLAGVGMCVVSTQPTSTFGENSLVLRCGDNPCLGARCPAEQKCLPSPGPECSPNSCAPVHCERIKPTPAPTAAPTPNKCLATSCETCTASGCKWANKQCVASCSGSGCISSPGSCGGCEAPTCLACVRQECQWNRGLCTVECTTPPCLTNARDCPLPCASMNDCASCTKAQCSWQGNMCKDRCSNALPSTCTTVSSNCIDPCIALKGLCAKGSQCQVGKDGFATCVCVKQCAVSVKAVCGSDGVTYDSQCDLDMVACKDNSELRTVSQGRCPSCDPKTCKFGAVCRGLKCECVNTCSNEQSPICGSDGVTYANTCRLKLATCVSEGFITLLRSGACDTGRPPSSPTAGNPYASSFASSPSSQSSFYPRPTPAPFTNSFPPGGLDPSVPSGFGSPDPSIPSGFGSDPTVPSGFGPVPSGFTPSTSSGVSSVPSGFSTGSSSSSSNTPPTASSSSSSLPTLGQSCPFPSGQCASGFICVVDSMVNGQPHASCLTDPNSGG